MYKTLVNTLKELNLEVLDIESQGYDNGSNMKGHISEVQAQMLRDNSGAFSLPCACIGYNFSL